MLQRQVLGQRYVIEDPAADLIGRGGMGGVFLGRDIHTEETVAIKALMPDVIDASEDLVVRFLREGEALRQLNHPNIVDVIDTITIDKPLPGNPKYFIVMDYVDGGSLEKLLSDRYRLTIREALEIGLDLADALTRTHRLGIIHRDIKPANVLISADLHPLLTDFGIAHFGRVSSFTKDGALMGTIDYFSPEALNGRVLDQRADIWSYGILLWVMLVGRPPFRRESVGATLAAILSDSLPDLCNLCPEAPESLSRLISLSLEKDRRDRIPSMRLIGAELEAILQDRAGKDLSKWHDIIANVSQEEPASDMPMEKAIPINKVTVYQTVNMMIRQSVERDEDVIAQPSLSFAATISDELELDYGGAALMLRSALFHGEASLPWIAKFNSGAAACDALRDYYKSYPPPGVRSAIVDALMEIDDKSACEILDDIGSNDDSSEIRTEAALACAEKGSSDVVIRTALNNVKERGDAVSLTTLAALVDRHGPPDDVDLSLKIQLSAVLAKKRWQIYRKAVRRQSIRVGKAGLLMIAVGAATPIMMKIMDPDGYEANVGTLALPGWLVGLVVMFGLYGFIQGLACGFFPGLADAIWLRGGTGLGRLLLSSPSGLVYSLALFLFIGLQAEARITQRVLYFPSTIFVGLGVGALLALVVPRLGESRPIRRQLLMIAFSTLLCVIINLPYLLFLYPVPELYFLVSRLLFVGLLPLIIGLPFLLSRVEDESMILLNEK